MAVFAGWDAYGDAVVDIDLGDRVVTVGKEGVLAGAAWVPPRAVHVITAHNPGRAASDEENESAQRHLHELLGARGLASFAAVGRSRDGSWQESSAVVVGISRHEAIEIAATFGQDAIFGWDGRTLQVIPVKSRAK